MDISAKKSMVFQKVNTAESTEPVAAVNQHKSNSHHSRKVDLSMARLSSMGIITSESVSSRTYEDFALIKLPLLKNAFGDGVKDVENGNLIMVTSSQPGEGKTYTAINLAMSMSMESDKRVLLIDADFARPSVTDVLGIEAQEGLMDYLLDPQMEFSQPLLKTSIPNLNILPCGKIISQATELLSSKAMSHLIGELAHRYSDRIVIFDAPPLLASDDAKILSALVGQIVIVVEAERTLRYVFNDAVSLLGQDKVIGLVLNKSNAAKRRKH